MIRGITQLRLVGMGGLMPVQRIVRKRCKAWMKAQNHVTTRLQQPPTK
jgi:hypothetical protein